MNNKSTNPDSSKTGMMKSVPVVLLLAMNPSLMDAKTISPQEPKQIPTEVVIPANGEPQYPKIASIPYGWRHLACGKIHYFTPVKGNGADYDMVYFTQTHEKDHPEWVHHVYLVEKGNTRIIRDPFAHPAEISALIYHNLGEGKEFCGVYITESLLDSKGYEIGKRGREIVLDDDAANLIIDLITGTSQWGNGTNIRFRETDKAELYPVATVMKESAKK